MATLATFRISTGEGFARYAVMCVDSQNQPIAGEWSRVQALIPGAWRYRFWRNGR